MRVPTLPLLRTSLVRGAVALVVAALAVLLVASPALARSASKGTAWSHAHARAPKAGATRSAKHAQAVKGAKSKKIAPARYKHAAPHQAKPRTHYA